MFSCNFVLRKSARIRELVSEFSFDTRLERELIGNKQNQEVMVNCAIRTHVNKHMTLDDLYILPETHRLSRLVPAHVTRPRVHCLSRVDSAHVVGINITTGYKTGDCGRHFHLSPFLSRRCLYTEATTTYRFGHHRRTEVGVRTPAG